MAGYVYAPDHSVISGGFDLPQLSSTKSTETPVVPTGPYPDRTLPSWLPNSPDAITPELADEYKKVGDAFSTAEFDKLASNAQAQDLTTGLNQANAAAAEYAAKVRQQGGSGAGSGVVKAQGQAKALSTAQQEKLDVAKFDMQQREAAASQSAQIASTLSGLRSDYLRTLTGYAASEDATATGKETTQDVSGLLDSGGGGGGGSRGGQYAIGGLIPSPGSIGGGSGFLFDPNTGSTRVLPQNWYNDANAYNVPIGGG